MATAGTPFTDLSPAKRRRPRRLAILMGAVKAAIEWSGAVLCRRILGRRHAKLRLPRSDALAGVFGAPVRPVVIPVRAADRAAMVGGAHGRARERPSGFAAPR
jgi:hypothetical protein